MTGSSAASRLHRPTIGCCARDTCTFHSKRLSFAANLWHEVGPLDPSLFFAMDYDLWLRIAAQAPVQYIAQTWANFRLHDEGKTITADERCWPEMLRIHYRDGGSVLSMIVAKYYVRKLVAPLLRWRRPTPTGARFLT